MQSQNAELKSARYTIGVDFGGTNVKLALVRFSEKSYRIEKFSTFPTKEYNRDALIEQLVIRIIKLKAESTFKGNKVRGVGIGVPGRVDFNKGMVFDLTNVPGWKNVHLKEILESKVKLPVSVDNDANLMALAESKFGAARGYKNCVCVTMGTGVGGGLIFNGKVYRGMNFAAGEIGHMTINENGPFFFFGSKKPFTGSTKG
ncbi:MAG: ROK family protein [Candidatus Omnitrophica bacterium]|nr:ROK family protein [Candidatus Omnitrophota bacterium]